MPLLRRLLGQVMLTASLGMAAVPAAAAQETAGACPEVAVIAARGSEQNEDLQPRRYAEGSPWVSNGYEAKNISQFLDLAERRHLARTGQSLLFDVPVIALDDTVYPAALSIPSIGVDEENLPLDVVLNRVNQVLGETPLPDLVNGAARSFLESVRTGVTRAGGYVTGWEEATGCRPDYILVGYSQGALVLNAQEARLASQGRLRGVVYLGNPLLAAGDPSIVGNAVTAGGMLKAVPRTWRQTAWDIPRVNYCLHGDLICDISVESVDKVIIRPAGEMTHIRYFDDPAYAETDALVADTFAGWITGGA